MSKQQPRRQTPTEASARTGLGRRASKNPRSRRGQRNQTGLAQTRTPVAKGTSYRNRKPKFSTSKGGAFVVTHTEYVRDIDTGSGLMLNELISPSNPDLFPWLATIAPSFEFFEFAELTFHCLTDNSTSISGAHMMAVDFDANTPPPTSKAELLTNECSIRECAWNSIHLPVPAHELRRFGKARSVSSTPGTDERLSALGRAYLMLTNFSTGDARFEVMVSYKVKLMTPCPPPFAMDSFVSSITTDQTTSNFLYDPSAIQSQDTWTGTYAPARIITAGVGDPAILRFDRPGFFQLTAYGESIGSELESSNNSFFNLQNPGRSYVTKLTAFSDPGQTDSWYVGYYNASDGVTDDAPWAGTEVWNIYVSPANSFPYYQDLGDMCATLADNDIAACRITLGPAPLRPYINTGLINTLPKMVLDPWVPSPKPIGSSRLHAKRHCPQRRLQSPICSSIPLPPSPDIISQLNDKLEKLQLQIDMTSKFFAKEELKEKAPQA